MNHRDFCRFVRVGLAVAGFLLFGSAGSFAADFQQDAVTREVETLLGGQFGGSGGEAPVFTDLGNGFYAVSMTLPPGVRERFLEAMGPEEQEKAASSLTVISVGQAPAVPSTPVTTTHGALSDTTFPYTYWIITLNLGSQTVTKTTTLKLTGPGLKFNRSTQVVYGANGIWGIGFRPGGGVGTPGIYTLQGTVSGGGSMTTKSFAVNP